MSRSLIHCTYKPNKRWKNSFQHFLSNIICIIIFWRLSFTCRSLRHQGLALLCWELPHNFSKHSNYLQQALFGNAYLTAVEKGWTLHFRVNTQYLRNEKRQVGKYTWFSQSHHGDRHLRIFRTVSCPIDISDMLKSCFSLEVYFQVKTEVTMKMKTSILYSQIISSLFHPLFRNFTSEDSHSLGLFHLQKDRRYGQHHTKPVLL